MINKVISVINRYDMLPSGATVVAAVSGGSDSMAMLEILNRVKNNYGINLCVAHVNHCLRGESADCDERFVRQTCDRMGLEFHLLRVDVAAVAKEKGMGFEECARQIRYDFFNSIGEKVIIATAHNLSDRTETMLFNLTRGSALRGLCSIPATRDNIIRPLIDCTKDEITEYCRNNSIEYMTDETNSDVMYSRNRIRHNVISELRKINSSFEACVLRCINSLNDDEEYLSSLAHDAVKESKCGSGYDVKALLKCSVPVLKRAVIVIVENEAGITPEYRSLENIIEIMRIGGSVQINGGITVRVRKGMLDFPCSETKKVNIYIETEIVNIDETNNLQFFSNQGLEFYLDYDKILGKVILRDREEGDKISLASRGCTKSLKKLFNELSVPPEKRNSVALVADDNGLLIVEGAGVDKRAAVTKETKRILVVKIIKENDGV